MALTKHAGWFDFLKPKRVGQVAKAVATNPYVMAAATPVIGAGMDAGISHVKKMLSAKRKAKAYKAMLAENPSLAKKPPKETQKFFNTLHSANPELAGDPIVASSWVHTQMEQQVPGVPHAGVVEGVGQLAKIRQAMRGPGSSGRPGVFQAAGQSVGQVIPKMHSERMQERIKELKSGEEKYREQADRFEAAARAFGG